MALSIIVLNILSSIDCSVMVAIPYPFQWPTLFLGLNRHEHDQQNQSLMMEL